MTYDKNQFQATVLLNDALNVLYEASLTYQNNHLTGKEIFRISFKFFEERCDFDINKIAISNFCQFLLNSNKIYTESSNASDKTNFKKSKKVTYKMFEMNDNVNYIKKSFQHKIMSSINDGITFLRKKIGLGTKYIMCHERKFCLIHLLKIIDLSHIENLIYLVDLSKDCEHEFDNISGEFQTKFHTQKEMNTLPLYNIHWDCIFYKLKGKINKIPQNVLSNLKDEYLNTIKTFIERPDLLKWNYLTQVFTLLPKLIKQNKKHLVIKILQLCFHLLPKKSFYLSEHLVLGLSNLFSAKSYEQKLYNKFAKLFNFDFKNQNYKTSLINFILKNSVYLFRFPSEIIQETTNMKLAIADFETLTVGKADFKEYEILTSEVTAKAICELYKNQKLQNNKNLKNEFLKFYGNDLDN